jgi:hypothetical protein
LFLGKTIQTMIVRGITYYYDQTDNI